MRKEDIAHALEAKGFILGPHKGWTEFALSIKHPTFPGMHMWMGEMERQPDRFKFGVFAQYSPEVVKPYERKLLAENVTEAYLVENLERLIAEGFAFAREVRNRQAQVV